MRGVPSTPATRSARPRKPLPLVVSAPPTPSSRTPMTKLLDATIVRAVLLPSVMCLLGERNWYLPSWLRWLPKAHGEAVAPVAITSVRQRETREFIDELSH